MMPTRPRVLIVEDDHSLRGMYRAALMFGGFDVEEAGDGLSALRRIDHSPPDLVVLDLGLPAIGGVVVRQDIAARAQTRHILVLVVTGSTEDLEYLDVPCVLRKPVTADRLVDAVKSCLAAGAPVPPSAT
jgi:DNA-binding response OmpR family regulator